MTWLSLQFDNELRRLSPVLSNSCYARVLSWSGNPELSVKPEVSAGQSEEDSSKVKKNNGHLQSLDPGDDGVEGRLHVSSRDGGHDGLLVLMENLI